MTELNFKWYASEQGRAWFAVVEKALLVVRLIWHALYLHVVH